MLQAKEINRPFVVCHMLASLDGKIDGDFFSVKESLSGSCRIQQSERILWMPGYSLRHNHDDRQLCRRGAKGTGSQ